MGMRTVATSGARCRDVPTGRRFHHGCAENRHQDRENGTWGLGVVNTLAVRGSKRLRHPQWPMNHARSCCWSSAPSAGRKPNVVGSRPAFFTKRNRMHQKMAQMSCRKKLFCEPPLRYLCMPCVRAEL